MESLCVTIWKGKNLLVHYHIPCFINLKLVNLLSGWKVRCAEFFPYSTYFEGSQSSATPNSALNQICKTAVNGTSSHSLGDHVVEHVASNGKLDTFKDLTI